MFGAARAIVRIQKVYAIFEKLLKELESGIAALRAEVSGNVRKIIALRDENEAHEAEIRQALAVQENLRKLIAQ